MFQVTSRNLGRSSRRRGAALVLVLIFTVAALMLASTLLALSRNGVVVEAERHRIKSLHAVLRAGAAASLNEINRDRFNGPYDPDGDGVGALLGPAVGGVSNGVEVQANGRPIGRYRTTLGTVTTGGTTRIVLTVTAAFPDFLDHGPDVPTLILAAQYEVDPGSFPSPERPFELLGNADGTDHDDKDLDKQIEEAEKIFKIKDGTLSVTADLEHGVPAVNMSDTVVAKGFGNVIDAEIASGEAECIGCDPNNAAALAEGSATVTGLDGNGRINMESMAALSNALNEYVTTTAPLATNLAQAVSDLGAVFDGKIHDDGHLHIGKGATDVEVTLPPGTYYLPGDLKINHGVTISGSGTLIVTKKLSLEHGSTLNWDGEVIVAGEEENKAELRIKHGGTLDVEGVLAVEGGEKKAKFVMDGGNPKDGATTLNVDGAFLLLTDALVEEDDTKDDKAEFRLKQGVDFNVDGVMAVVGEHIHFKADKDAQMDVNGSFTILVPEDAKKGLHKFEVKKGADVSLDFDPTQIGEGVDTLNDLLEKVLKPKSSPFPANLSAYWERVGETIAAEQLTAIAAGNVGMEDQ